MDSKNIIAFADKTNNFYELEPDRYKKLLLENITKDYKKADNKTIEEINDEANFCSTNFIFKNHFKHSM